MLKNIEFPIPNLNHEDELVDSTLIRENINTLNDGRPDVTQVWTEDDCTFITHYIPSIGLEEFTPNQLVNYLIRQGASIPHDINDLRVTTMKYCDMLQSECWSITIVVDGVDF